MFFSSTKSYRDIGPADVLSRRAELKIIDVREPSEFHGDLGHVPGSELVPMDAVARAAEGWDRSAAIVLVCRSGARSGRIADMLGRKGFSKVHNLAGGMVRWNNEGHAVER